MTASLRIIAIALIAWLAGAAADRACAERLIVSVSNHRVTVTSNYVGEELVLFGSVESDGPGQPLRSSYDLVVTVSGPKADMVTRRKERRFGIWANADSRQFLDVPAYLAISSNRPIDQIASPDAHEAAGHGAAEGPEGVVHAVREAFDHFSHFEVDDDFGGMIARDRRRHMRRFR